jgi:hypothetical protein
MKTNVKAENENVKGSCASKVNKRGATAVEKGGNF